ncbi:hypothetical protein SLW70_12890 [Flavobacterium sp. NG2]|uniref:hypothetical protein n=1 Tax=Flavobacterium sp. NG2 TaxID=3097547 RepID=UPI002A83670B|nr:hypothetical protein [Flavobacterium sp. NG2]WPR70822.1 hypothetical protein SLW70_12890 [Flavobacterium sp. NG2]
MTKQDLKLIDGVYTPNEAIEILMNVYNRKIEFHELKNFSSEVCSGNTDTVAAKRIAELKEDIETIKTKIKEAQELNKKLIIKSIVEIQFIENN